MHRALSLSPSALLWNKRCAKTGRGRAAVTDRAGQGRQKDLGNFRIWFSRHGF